ncbi:unnamed protein product [Malus baccata var. baccata]
MATLGKTDEFELKSSLLHHIPKFQGMSIEDPNKHLKEFEVVCSSMTPVNVDGGILKMKAFPFSLLEKAKDWLYELAPGTVTSWESMKRAFLEKFFPTSQVILLRKRISGIQQNQGESFPTYYKRFKTLVASCPQHQMKEELLLQYFYEELLPIKRQMLDALAGGALVDKTPMAAKTLIANRALNAQQYEGVGQRDTPGQQVNEEPQQPNNKEALGSNLQASIPSNTHQHKPHNNLPKILQGQENQAKAMQNQDKRVDQMEKQIGQIAEEQGKLPSSTVVNPKGGFESAKAMSLRSGKQVGFDPQPSKSRFNERRSKAPPQKRVETPLPQAPNAHKPSNSANKGKKVPILIKSNVVPPNVPFPRRFMQSKKEEAEKDILETFRKVQVYIPLLDAIKQVPKYAKFLIELCTTKRRMSKKEVVKVNHLIFPTDFYILNMEDSVHSTSLPILFGRPFMKTACTKIDVFKGTLTMEFDGEVIDFNISETMRYPVDDHSCFSIDVIDSLVQEYLEELNEDALEIAITKGIEFKNRKLGAMQTHSQIWDPNAVPFNEEVVEVVAALESLPRQYGKVPLSISSLVSTKMLPSIVQAPTLELKPLLDHLKYVFLGDDETLPVIVSSSLTEHEEEKLVKVLRKHKTAIGWTLADIRGISPTTCMHRILLKEWTKPSREAQCRLNPPMMEVVKKEIIKLLDYGVIYPISDSHWVSPVQVVSKKSGVTVVKNDENELVPTRIQTGWRVCIDYRKLNATTSLSFAIHRPNA